MWLLVDVIYFLCIDTKHKNIHILYILKPMAVASLTAIGGIPQGMNRGSRMYWPNAREMTAIAAGLKVTHRQGNTNTLTVAISINFNQIILKVKVMYCWFVNWKGWPMIIGEKSSCNTPTPRGSAASFRLSIFILQTLALTALQQTADGPTKWWARLHLANKNRSKKNGEHDQHSTSGHKHYSK